MAEHGYARDYDEPIDRGDEVQESWRDHRGGSRERGSGGEWSNRDRALESGSRDRNQRNINFMLGDPDRRWEESESRGGYRRNWDRGNYGAENYGRMRNGLSGQHDWEPSRRNYSSHQDDHYRSWRDRQMEALDRDYADYCREREQKFHSDFDDWRRNREQRGRQTQASTRETQEAMELTQPVDLAPNPTAEATLGTNTPENSGVGRS